MMKKLTMLIACASWVSVAQANQSVRNPLKSDNTVTEISEQLTIIGTRISTALADKQLSKVVITSDDISALALNSFTDVIRGVAGIDVFEQGGAGGLTYLSIRGGEPNFVAIVIDGVQVNDPTNSRGGAFDLGTIDPTIIEKVEIFYGSFSSIYGSDALAGLINIVTKGVKKNSLVGVGLKVGSNETFGFNAHIGLPINEFIELSAIGSIQNNDNSTFGDAFSRQQWIASLKSTSLDSTQFKISGFHARGDSQYYPEDSGGDRLAIIRQPELRNFEQSNISLFVQQLISPSFQLTLNSHYTTRQESVDNPGIFAGFYDGIPAIKSDSNFEKIATNIYGNYQYSKQLSFAAGIYLTNEDGGMESVIDFGVKVPANYRLYRQTRALFLEFANSSIDNLYITTGFRIDKSDDISMVTHRLTSQYTLSGSNSLLFQFSEGFKLPSFFALAHPFVGNPTLKPEQSKNIELALNNNALDDRLTSRLSVYRNTYTELVDFDAELFTNVNRTKVTATGVEVSMSFRASEQFSLSGQVSYNNLTTHSNTVLRRRPEWKGGLLLRYKPFDALAFTSRIAINSGFYDSSIPTGMIKLSGATLVDMSAMLTLDNALSFRLSISDNLANSEQSIGFENQGTNITLSMSKSF